MLDKLPLIYYPIDYDGKKVAKLVGDISHHVRLTESTINNVVNFEYQTLSSGESLEIAAGENYDRPVLGYILGLANDRLDWRESYPLTESELEDLVKEKYADRNGIHHFEDPLGNIVDNTYGDNESHSYPKNVIPITNIDYERRENDKKRALKVISNQHIDFVKDLVTNALGTN